jgi:hypothetical protein
MGDAKWEGWNKPETVISRMAAKVQLPPHLMKLLKPGTFRFDDSTLQGWKIDQLYDSNGPTLTKITPYTDPTTNAFYGFTLANHQNLGLAASAYPFLLPQSTSGSIDFYLQSPDLGQNAAWVGVKGYSLDLQRNFFSWCNDNPASYKVQLQALFLRKEDSELVVYGEWDSVAGQHIMHDVKSFTPYHFVWTADVFTDQAYSLHALRIRCTQPHLNAPGAGECLPKGAWLVGNVAPE